ncbi:MAG: nickel pincer cofactor biosynthesis protein LarC [bacterium]|nr:nickel pincer cofactor biosynthesis protein LarC [bacterium]
MARIASMDLSTGISGDKFLGAMIQASEKLGIMSRQEFAAIFESALSDVEVSIHDVCVEGISGLKIDVIDKHEHEHGHHHHDHDHHHDHGRHDHDHDHGDGHFHRHWSDIRAMILEWEREGRITTGASGRAIATFTAIAEAEAKVHGKSVEDVAFHEVGAIDSIVDIIGACILLDVLGIERLYSSPMIVGFGTVKCAHGILPVPAPATALICEGLPTAAGPNEGEMTTPTGGAICKANVTDWAPMPCIVPTAIGTGFGTRNIEGAYNALRVIIGDETSEFPQVEGDFFKVEQCALLQTNIDHVSPEAMAICCEDLLVEGALDVWQQPITMKKGRLAIELDVLCKVSDAQRIAESIYDKVGALGIRRSIVERTVAPREQIEVETRFGSVRFKCAGIGRACDRAEWVRPESDDVARISREFGMSPAEVSAELMEVWRSR